MPWAHSSLCYRSPAHPSLPHGQQLVSLSIVLHFLPIHTTTKARTPKQTLDPVTSLFTTCWWRPITPTGKFKRLKETAASANLSRFNWAAPPPTFELPVPAIAQMSSFPQRGLPPLPHHAFTMMLLYQKDTSQC